MEPLTIDLDLTYAPMADTITPCRLFFQDPQFKNSGAPELNLGDEYQPDLSFANVLEYAYQQPHDGHMQQIDQVQSPLLEEEVLQFVNEAMLDQVSPPDLYADYPLDTSNEVRAEELLLHELENLPVDPFMQEWLSNPHMRADALWKRKVSCKCWVSGCKAQLDSNLELLMHLSTHSAAERQKSRTVFCQHEGCHYQYIGFAYTASRERHVRMMHNGSAMLSCVYCGNTFKRRDSAQRHLQSGACRETISSTKRVRMS